jgi:hypothetical protein
MRGGGLTIGNAGGASRSTTICPNSQNSQSDDKTQEKPGG